MCQNDDLLLTYMVSHEKKNINVIFKSIKNGHQMSANVYELFYKQYISLSKSLLVQTGGEFTHLRNRDFLIKVTKLQMLLLLLLNVVVLLIKLRLI